MVGTTTTTLSLGCERVNGGDTVVQFLCGSSCHVPRLTVGAKGVFVNLPCRTPQGRFSRKLVPFCLGGARALMTDASVTTPASGGD